MITPVIGRPGIQSGSTVSYNDVFAQPESVRYFPGGGIIDKTSQDRASSNPLVLRGGLPMGRITSSRKWSPAFLAKLNAAVSTQGVTTLTLAAADVLELIRRVGASGTFTLIGPTSANGVARSVTVTFSAASGTTVTITAISVNEVQTVAFPIASTGGSVALELWDPRINSYVKVEAAAWSAVDATYLSNIQVKLDLAFGAANIVVVSAQAATDTDSALLFTYSGTGVAGQPVVDGSGNAKLPVVTTLPTSSTSYTVARTTSGVDGRFVNGSLIGVADGSAVPRSVVPSGSGINMVTANAADVDFPKIPSSAMLISANIIDWPSDTGLQNYIMQSMNPTGWGNGFDFDHLMLPA